MQEQEQYAEQVQHIQQEQMLPKSRKCRQKTLDIPCPNNAIRNEKTCKCPHIKKVREKGCKDGKIKINNRCTKKCESYQHRENGKCVNTMKYLNKYAKNVNKMEKYSATKKYGKRVKYHSKYKGSNPYYNNPYHNKECKCRCSCNKKNGFIPYSSFRPQYSRHSRHSRHQSPTMHKTPSMHQSHSSHQSHSRSH